MKNELTEEQVNQVIKALDDAIEQGPWDKSNFLKLIGKNLCEIRDNLMTHLSTLSAENTKIASNLANRIALRSGQQEVFIGLYSSDGNSIQSWERILSNLPKQIISRPVYANEKDVKDLIKTKEKKINEAYVSIYVNRNDLLSLAPDKVPVDKLGRPLLSLKNKSIDLENINHFVHLSSVYTYSKGRLQKKDLPE